MTKKYIYNIKKKNITAKISFRIEILKLFVQMLQRFTILLFKSGRDLIVKIY